MQPWTRYFLERLNPLLSLPIIVGIAISGVVLNKNLFQLLPFILSSIFLFYIAFVLRLNNDLEDYDRDAIAFPHRALPRKLLSKNMVQKALRFLDLGLIFFFVILFLLGWANTRIAVILCAAYFWLLRHDFYAKEWLKRRLLIYNTAKQLFFFFLVILVVSIGRPSLAFTPTVRWVGLSDEYAVRCRAGAGGAGDCRILSAWRSRGDACTGARLL